MSRATTLALLDGTPVVRAGLHRPSPHHARRELRALRRAMRTTPHDLADPDSPIVARFEQAVATYHGVSHAIGVATDLDALWAALVCNGVTAGTSVIVSALAGPAAHAVVQAGARPLFCDVDPATGNLDASLVDDLVRPDTRAILVSHAHGQPADLHELNAVADAHDLVVVEDATQAFGATSAGRPVGVRSNAGIVSAHARSPLAGNAGALVVTSDAALARALRRVVGLGRDWTRPGPGEHAANWPRGFGRDCPISPLDAALGLAKLPGLDIANAWAQHHARTLTHGLERLAGLRAPTLVADTTATYHEFPVRLEPDLLGWHRPAADLRDRVVQALVAEGVPTTVLAWQPLSRLPLHRVDQPGRVRAVDDLERPLAPWDPDHSPAAADRFETTIVLGPAPYPLRAQRGRLMARYLHAIEKVIANLDALADAPLAPLRPVPPIPLNDR